MTTATMFHLHLLATIGDPEGTRTITALVALLAALGLALVMVAIWVFRTTRPDPSLLAPLETMGERNWRRLDPVAQRRRLDELRPDGAEPIAPSVAPPEFDAAFDVAPAAPGFDDLVDDGTEVAAGHIPTVAAAATTVGSETPKQLDRPGVDQFDDEDMDPDVLAAASADLDAELLGRSAVDGEQPATLEFDEADGTSDTEHD